MPSPTESSVRAELRERLRQLRLARGLSQRELGLLLGVNQKRIARIEAAPELAGLGQILRLLGLLGARMEIVDTQSSPDAASVRQTLRQGRGRPSREVLARRAAEAPSAESQGGREAPAAKASTGLTDTAGQSGTDWSSAWD